jgi:hypothetical protein
MSYYDQHACDENEAKRNWYQDKIPPGIGFKQDI